MYCCFDIRILLNILELHKVCHSFNKRWHMFEAFNFLHVLFSWRPLPCAFLGLYSMHPPLLVYWQNNLILYTWNVSDISLLLSKRDFSHLSTYSYSIPCRILTLSNEILTEEFWYICNRNKIFYSTCSCSYSICSYPFLYAPFSMRYIKVH